MVVVAWQPTSMTTFRSKDGAGSALNFN